MDAAHNVHDLGHAEAHRDAAQSVSIELSDLRLHREELNRVASGENHGGIQIVRSLWPITNMAAEVVAMTKPELIEMVCKTHDKCDDFLMELADARDTAKALAEVVGAAEARLTVALANVEANEDSPVEKVHE